MITKNPSDFVGAALGVSEQNTKAILSNAMGKVLIIDEVGQNILFLLLSGIKWSFCRHTCSTMGHQDQDRGPILIKQPLLTPSWPRYKAYQARIVVCFSSDIEIK